jgi:hypothetical protein
MLKTESFMATNQQLLIRTSPLIVSTITVMLSAWPHQRMCDIVFMATFGKKHGGDARTKFEVIPMHIFLSYRARVVLTKFVECVVAILDFDMVNYFSIVTYYTSHLPNFNILGSIFLSDSTHAIEADSS